MIAKNLGFPFLASKKMASFPRLDGLDAPVAIVPDSQRETFFIKGMPLRVVVNRDQRPPGCGSHGMSANPWELVQVM